MQYFLRPRLGNGKELDYFEGMNIARLSSALVTYHEGVLIFEFQNNVEIGEKEAREQLAAGLKLAQGKPCPVIIVDNHPLTTITPEARNILSKASPEIPRLCEAFVVSSLAKKVMVNFYIKVQKPANPAKVFTGFSQAWRWAKSFT